jgi:deoxyribodipyrimidine photo-lyase
MVNMITNIAIIFREFRLTDNNVISAMKPGANTNILLFCFDDRQLKNNPYFCTQAFRMLCECVGSMPITSYKMRHVDALTLLKRKYKDIHVSLAEDYTPFAQSRQLEIELWCKKNDVECLVVRDHVLSWPHKPYLKYTPFARIAEIDNRTTGKTRKIFTVVHRLSSITANGKKYNIVDGKHRSRALQLLRKAANMKYYLRTRNFPLIPTTGLSQYLKFGVVSIREVYNGVHKSIHGELLWRDFYYQVAYYNPHVFGKSLNSKWDTLKWGHSEIKFAKWCDGKTGFPIVDAGMRELNKTGKMHNRLRMIVASFLTKLLRIDWRWGEQYFATKLVDYDPCQNNGGWQWSAGIGADAQPYFRIFNPVEQHKKYDPESAYVKTWVTELKNKTHKEILQMYDNGMIPYSIERNKTIKWFQNN